MMALCPAHLLGTLTAGTDKLECLRRRLPEATLNVGAIVAIVLMGLILSVSGTLSQAELEGGTETEETTLTDSSVFVASGGALAIRDTTQTAQIPSEWMADGAAAAYLVRVRVEASGEISVRIADTITGTGSDLGPDILTTLPF